MKISLGTRMTESPQGGLTIVVFQDTANTKIDRMIFSDEGAEIDNQVKPQIVLRLIEGAGQDLEGCLLSHPLSVVAETVDIPVAIGGQIDLPVSP